MPDTIADPKCMALLNVAGTLEYVEAKGIPDLRKILRKFPASALVCVWRGRKIPLKREVKISFSGGL